MALQVFTSGQTLTASQMNTLQASTYNYPTATVSTATHTLSSTDAGYILIFTSSANPVEVTVPSGLSMAAGDSIEIIYAGTGTLNLIPAAGVTINSEGNLTTIYNQWARVSLIKTSSNTFILSWMTAISEAEITNGSVTASKIGSGAVTEGKIATGAVTEAKLGAEAVTSSKIASAVAGDGLSGGAGNPLSVNVDSSTIETNADTLRVKDLGITTAKLANASVTSDKIASAIAGNGLSGGAGSALAVNVDSSTIEINADTLRVKDLGISSAKLANDLSIVGTTQIEEIVELVNRTTTAPATTEQVYLKSGGVHFRDTNTLNAFNINITGDATTALNNIISIGQSVTVVFIVRCNSTSHFPGTITVDTTGTITGGVRWFGGVTPSASTVNAGSVMVYSFTLLKTASATWTVLASESRFG